MKFRVIIVFVFFACCLSIGISIAHNKVAVIPLIDDGITCSGILVGTRWCDNGDQTVTDMTTGLIWLRHADWGEEKPWRSDTPGGYDDAHTRAGLLEDGEVVYYGIGGYEFILNDGSDVGDWRLPTKTELYNLIRGTEAVRNSSMRAFRGVQPSLYWSSSTWWEGAINYARVMHMENGTQFYDEKIDSHYVWPVRSSN